MSIEVSRTRQDLPDASQVTTLNSPLVSIGMPVYNGEAYISEALDTLIAQTFTDFELIISDNASTDNTEAICQDYLKNDSRIRYIRQAQNRGPIANFKFVLYETIGTFFMWAAADDRWSVDFLEVNVRALQLDSHLSASTCPNCYEGEQDDPTKYVSFALLGSKAKRYLDFLDNASVSHGIFYSLMRAHIIKNYDFPDLHYAAYDWSLNLYILSKGEISRSINGLTIFGVSGSSNQGNPWKLCRTSWIEKFLPLYQFSKSTIPLLVGLSFPDLLSFLIRLLKLNLHAAKSNFVLTFRDFL